MDLELKNVAEEVSDVRDVVRNMEFGARVEILLGTANRRRNSLDPLSE